jgi:DNA replication and repair protein RecF
MITLEEFPFKSLASQGQRKSMLFALKLASYYYIAVRKNTPPVLLLDDVFEKLDADRMLNLLKEVVEQLQGQVFITDTHSERLKAAFEELGQTYQLIELTTNGEQILSEPAGT